MKSGQYRHGIQLTSYKVPSGPRKTGMPEKGAFVLGGGSTSSGTVIPANSIPSIRKMLNFDYENYIG